MRSKETFLGKNIPPSEDTRIPQNGTINKKTTTDYERLVANRVAKNEAKHLTYFIWALGLMSIVLHLNLTGRAVMTTLLVAVSAWGVTVSNNAWRKAVVLTRELTPEENGEMSERINHEIKNGTKKFQDLSFLENEIRTTQETRNLSCYERGRHAYKCSHTKSLN